MSIIRQIFVSSGFIIFLTFSLLLVTDNDVFAIEFSNYTSEKYGIQFEYPSDWKIQEKTSRFDNDPDLMIADYLRNTNINIVHIDSTSPLVELMDGVGFEKMIDLLIQTGTSDFGKKYQFIEQPSMMSIDGKETSTFLFTEQDKYDDYATKYAKQFWITNFNYNKVYNFAFIASTYSFDNPENIEIRDHFIKSIKFLGNTGSQSTIKEFEPQQKSRFD